MYTMHHHLNRHSHCLARRVLALGGVGAAQTPVSRSMSPSALVSRSISAVALASASGLAHHSLQLQPQVRLGLRAGFPHGSLLVPLPRGFQSPLGVQSRSLFIQTESTPSEDSLKFKPGCPVLGAEARSTVEVTSVREAQAMGSPLAATLLRINGVQSILFGSDFVTVTKSADDPWQLIKPDVFGALSDFFGDAAATTATGDDAGTAAASQPHKQVVNPELAMQPPQDTEIRPDDSEVVAMIKELLDTRIRPTIQDDGGDIEYMGFEEDSGTVKLKLKGACRTCDSSVVTLKNGIENMLQYFIPEVKKVEQVLDEAERIANEEFAKLEQVIGLNNSNEGQVLLKKD